MAYDNERIGNSVMEHLQDHLPAQLDVVEAAWASADPLTLPDPETWFAGYKPTILEQPASAFPYVAVMVPAREPAAGIKATWGYQAQRVQAFVDFAVCADTEAEVNKLAHRYAEALCATLRLSADFSGYSQVNYEPPIRDISFTRHLKDPENSDAFDEDDVYYLVLRSIGLTLEGSV